MQPSEADVGQAWAMPPQQNARPARATPLQRAGAWFTHLVTTTGAVFGLFAVVAAANHEWRAALFWMAGALAIDSVDGTLARRFRVRQVLPSFDGTLLDNLVDYFNYAVVPAVFLYHAALLPAGWDLAGAAAIVVASAYQFSRVDAKTSDHFFTGFPSYWNAVVFYIFLLQPPPGLGLAVIVAMCVLVFVPFRFVYPSRTPAFRRTTIALTIVWGVLCLVALATYPAHSLTLVWLSLLYVPYYVGISLLAQRRARLIAS